MNRLLLLFLVSLALLPGCDEQHQKREVTRSTINWAADRWNGSPEFHIDAKDAWGSDISCRVTKKDLFAELTVRSNGPDGRPFNSDDLCVTRHKKLSNKSLNEDLADGAEHISAGLVRGVKKELSLRKGRDK